MSKLKGGSSMEKPSTPANKPTQDKPVTSTLHGVGRVCEYCLIGNNIQMMNNAKYDVRRSYVMSSGSIYKISYDYLTTMPKLRSTYDGCIICQTSYEECRANS